MILNSEKQNICQNSKIVKTEKFHMLGATISTPSILGKGKPRQTEIMAHG